MLQNPFVNPSYVPTLIRIFAVLFLLLLGAVWRWRKAKKTGRQSKMLSKMITACWMAALLITSVFAGTGILLLIIAALLVQAVREYSSLVRLDSAYRLVLLGSSLAALSFAAANRGTMLISSPLIVLPLTTLIPIVSGRTDGAHRQVSAVLFGFLYITVPLSLIIYIRESASWGLQFVLIAGSAIAFADAGAFVLGSWLKGPHLAPAVSPAKTWSGVGGAFLGAAAALALMWPLAPAGWTLATMSLLWLAVAVGAVWGDLIESFVKRDYAAKDAGSVLAGFGGILDRFDSFFLAIPIAYASLRLIS